MAANFPCGATALRLVVLLLGLVFFAPLQAAEGWCRCLWKGEQGWRCASGEWLAIVSVDRGRLSYLGPRNGAFNLLYEGDNANLLQASSWGGHRFWLGPQADWRDPWPPPLDWERASAFAVNVAGETLTIVMPDHDSTFPQLARVYSWLGSNLRVVGRWAGKGYQAIHILQLPASAQVIVGTAKSADLTNGFGILPTANANRLDLRFRAWPKVASQGSDDACIVQNRKIESKLGFPAGPIFVKEDHYGLSIQRGTLQGRIVAFPDAGLLTQIYTGDARNPYTEAEQLSPIVDSSRGRDNSFEITLHPIVLPR